MQVFFVMSASLKSRQLLFESFQPGLRSFADHISIPIIWQVNRTVVSEQIVAIRLTGGVDPQLHTSERLAVSKAYTPSRYKKASA
jgi:hypothetical protein